MKNLSFLARTSLPLLVALVAATSQGCGYSETPVLEDFKLSAASVEAGETATGTATVEDDDADLSGGKMVVTLRAGEVVETKELPINLGDSAGKAALSLSLEIGLLAPRGDATVELQVYDSAGHASNMQSAPLAIE